MRSPLFDNPINNYFPQIPMNKYLSTIIAGLILVLAFMFYYMSPTKQWERQVERYQEDINEYKSSTDQLIQDNKSMLDLIKTLSWKILDNSKQINSNSEAIEKTELCIKANSMDCANGDKTAMLHLIPQANATVEWEDSEQDIREDILFVSIPSTTTSSGRITEYYTNNPSGDQCSNFRSEPKRIVLHYTATPDSIPVGNIVASHHRKNGTVYYAGYHYIVDKTGKIYRTRPENCNALAEPVANHDGIHIAYIGDDKPTKAQVDSIVWLTKDVSKRLSIPIGNVTAHADIAPKNHKESLEYMFGGYQAFQKLIRLTQTITRDGKQMDSITYAWQAWWDMDFILTIQKESQFNNESKGDIDRPNKWDYSYGYCQYNVTWQHLWLAEYVKLKTWQEQLNHCHEKYVYASTLKWGVWSRFHGYDTRLKNASRFVVQ